MENRFEVVQKYKDKGIKTPQRATIHSAGYDIGAAESIVVPPWHMCVNSLMAFKDTYKKEQKTFTLEEVQSILTATNVKPTLISTGIKCKLKDNEYLSLISRSSTPMKYWLIIPNAVGVIDSDYYNNSGNEGEIFIQLINLSPFPINVKEGDLLVQGIISEFVRDNSSTKTEERIGGLGSTYE